MAADTVTALSFTALGKPAPAGSKRAFPFQRADGSLGARTRDDSESSAPWKATVSAAAVEAMERSQAAQLAGPLTLRLEFYVRRPASHYGTGRNLHRLKDSAPATPATRPDATKLTRAVEDAMTEAGVWRDDAQVVTQLIRKCYGTPERVEVHVWEMAG